MDVQAITTLVSCVGFPVVACGAMAWYVRYITDQNNRQIEKLTESHKSEMSEVTEAIHNNTVALQKLTDYLTLMKGENKTC